MPSATSFNAEARRALKATELTEPRLQRAYQRAIRELGVIARRNFLRTARVSVVAAAGDDWHVPDVDELFTLAEGSELLELRTRAAREAMVLAATGPWYGDLDPVVRNRITGEIERLLGSRITEVADHIRRDAGLSLRTSLDKGLSIDHAAAALTKDFVAFSRTRATLIARTEMIGAANAGSLGVARATGAASHKTWLATADSRTRPTHGAANGQTVALSESFVVGGALLRFPGDENAPASEVCNCRCTMTYGDAPDQPSEAGLVSSGDDVSNYDLQEDPVPEAITASDERHEERVAILRAAADLPTSISVPGVLRFVTAPADVGVDKATGFAAILAPIGQKTGDGRMLDPSEPGAISWRDLPLSLMAQFETQDGHDGALIAGRIDSIEVAAASVGDWSGQAFLATGVFDDAADGSDAGREAARLARSGALRGVSIDLAVDEVELRTADNTPIEADDEEAWLDAILGNGIMVVTRGKIMGATITPFPAFEEASVTVVASLDHAPMIEAFRGVRGEATVASFSGEVVELQVEPVPVPPITLGLAQAFAVLVAGGLTTINEARGWLGLARVVGGDMLRVSSSEPEPEPERVDTAGLAASLATVAGVNTAMDAALATFQTVTDQLSASIARVEEAAAPKPRRLQVVRDADGRAVRYEEEHVSG